VNSYIKDQILARGKKTRPLVQQYLPHIVEKIDQMGPAAGIWLENLNSDFAKLKPEGLMEGFTTEDFRELRRVLFGASKK
jgi:hypothetical protein